MFKKNIFHTETIRGSYGHREVHASNFIPYKCHWNRNTILTKNNELLKVIKVDGFSFETADDEDLDIKKSLRNGVFKGMASGNVILYFHTIRKQKPTATATDYTIDPTISNNVGFAEYLENLWNKKNSLTQSFFNELYISILYKPDKQGAAVLEYIYKSLRQKSDKSNWGNDMRELYDSLEETSAVILNAFRDYGAHTLGVVNRRGRNYCEILEFLGTLVNCGQGMPMLLPEQSIDTYLPTHRLFFDGKHVEVRGPNGNYYGGMISVAEYGPRTSAGVLDRFLRMPFAFIMCQSFIFANRSVAIQKMQLQQNRMIQAQDNAISQIAEISQALDMATSGDIGFGEHHWSLLCIDSNSKTLENIMSIASVELGNCGMRAVRERINLEPCFWGQLPGNSHYIVRKSIINTMNLAGFCSMHNYPLGKMRHNHWGDYVTILNTTSGTPYYFNFHVRDVGHTLIIGPTGAGKTVLMNFLCAQAQKFKPRMYFFDKDRGAEIFIRALRGVYNVIDPGSQCHFNPLQLPDTGENRSFLLEWLKLLVTTNNEPVTAQDMKLLSLAIDGNFKLNKQDRKLSNIVPFLGIDGPGSLVSRISPWYGSGSHAKIFDNDVDKIDLTQAKVFGFEMAELLRDSIALPPVLLYIFHRINISLDGYQTIIVLDEAWALIDNPIFAPKIRDWLKVLRKLNTFVIFATQSVEDATKSKISDTLVQQTATQIFLPNLKATDVYRSVFMLSRREYVLIKTTDPSSRYFLVKQGLNAVVAKIDLAGMEDVINVLSGRADTVLMLRSIMQEYGGDPEIWLPVFYEKARSVQK